MPAPLIIAGAAAGLGGLRAALGIGEANRRKKRAISRIHQAYDDESRDLTTRQGDVRSATQESLNARGLLQAGRPTASTQPRELSAIERVYEERKARGITATPPGWGDGRLDRFRAEQDQLHASATAGAVGPANTLGGGVQTELGQEFYREHQDLSLDRENAIDDARDNARAEKIGAVASGVSAGVQAYSIGSSIKGAFGIDPLNPTSALSSPTGFTTDWHGGDANFAFNVTRGR